jgi:hypothetical protein
MKTPPLRGFFHSRILVELYSNPGSWFRGRLRRIASRRGPPFSAIAKGASFIEAPFAMLKSSGLRRNGDVAATESPILRQPKRRSVTGRCFLFSVRSFAQCRGALCAMLRLRAS